MKSNPNNNNNNNNNNKYHVNVSENNEMSICVNNYNIANNKCEKLLGIKTAHNTNSNTHIDKICKKA